RRPSPPGATGRRGAGGTPEAGVQGAIGEAPERRVAAPVAASRTAAPGGARMACRPRGAHRPGALGSAAIVDAPSLVGAAATASRLRDLAWCGVVVTGTTVVARTRVVRRPRVRVAGRPGLGTRASA